MRRKTKTPNIVVGDTVKIVKPEFFIRCGYPMDFWAEVERIKAEKGAEIGAFLKSQGIRYDGERVERTLTIAFDKVAKAIAFAWVKQSKFGGNYRKIYTHPIHSRVGQFTVVDEVRFVKSGTLSPGHTDQYGEYDPPYLSGEKTHRILKTGMLGSWPGMRDPEHEDYLWIEADNVELAEAVECKTKKPPLKLSAKRSR